MFVFYKVDKEKTGERYFSYNYAYKYLTSKDGISADKIENAVNAIENKNNIYTKLFSIEDKNAFLDLELKIYMSLNQNLNLTQIDKSINTFVINNDTIINYGDHNYNYYNGIDIYSEYNKCVKNNALSLFKQKYGDYAKIGNSLITGSAVFISNNLKKIKNQNQYDYCSYESQHENKYLIANTFENQKIDKTMKFFNSSMIFSDTNKLLEIKKTKDKPMKLSFFHSNFDSKNNIFMFNDLIEFRFINHYYFRFSDFNINLNKTPTVYDIVESNPEIQNIMKKNIEFVKQEFQEQYNKQIFQLQDSIATFSNNMNKFINESHGVAL